MAATKPPPRKQYFTPARPTPRCRSFASLSATSTELAKELRERHERLSRVLSDKQATERSPRGGDASGSSARSSAARTEMREYERELQQLGIELKDYFTGLIDFPCRMDGREVYLCWRLGEPEVAYWHELDAGFARTAKTDGRHQPRLIAARAIPSLDARERLAAHELVWRCWHDSTSLLIFCCSWRWALASFSST